MSAAGREAAYLNKGMKQTSYSLASSFVLPGMRLNREQARPLQLIPGVRHGDIGKMKDAYIKMKELLKALINYTNKSGNFNPHFYKNEIMDSLSISEGEFNIIQKSLGDKYCHYVDSHGGSDRYSINMSECLALQEQHDQEFINEKRHKQLVRLAVLIAVLGATLGATLSVWFSKEG